MRLLFQFHRFLVHTFFFRLTVISIDRSGFVSLLPNFFLFTVSLIAGSRALSHLPILVCICVANVVPASIYLLDNVSLKKSSVVQVISSLVVLVTSIPILLASEDDTEELESLMDSPKFWLVGKWHPNFLFSPVFLCKFVKIGAMHAKKTFLFQYMHFVLLL